MTNQLYVDQQGDLHTLADRGVTWASPEQIADWGWKPAPRDYRPPAPAPDKTVQIAALDAEYEPQFVELARAWANANMDGNTKLATGIAADRAALKSEYDKRREAIANG